MTLPQDDERLAADLPPSAFGALEPLVAAFVERQPRWSVAGSGSAGSAGPPKDGAVAVRNAQVVRPGRPGLISVTASVAGLEVHAVLGLRSPGEEVRFLADADESPLGILEDGDGLAVVFDATVDAELMVLLLEAVAGAHGDPDWVRRVAVTREAVVLSFDDRLAFTVFQLLPPAGGPNPGLELFLGLDRVGFNHVLAPISRWRRAGTDLGIVQEYQVGAAGGWALALTSLRDLYASGSAPELAGGDFAAEARQLGTMTARMHLGLDQAFGRRPGDISVWVDEVEASVRAADPGLLEDGGVAAMLADLRASGGRGVAIRTHGDFHLGRVARTDQGWFVVDFSPGGSPLGGPGAAAAADDDDDDDDGMVFRSPLADVADMLWSFHHVATVAATERDPDGHLGLGRLAQEWEVRNRRAFLAGYLATPGIGGLVPPVRDTVRKLASAFELGRSAARLTAGT